MSKSLLRFTLWGIVVALCLSTLALPASAADNQYVFLYNWLSGTLVRINTLDGAQETVSLGLDQFENVHLGGSDLTFTADGNRAAFCAVSYAPDTMIGSATLVLRDLMAGTDLLQIDLGHTIGCKTGAFNADETLVTVSLVNYFPGDPNTDTGTGEPIWRLLVLDTASGTITQELNADSPAVTASGMMIGTPILADVRAFDGSRLGFTEVPWGIGGVPTLHGFEWDFSANTVTTANLWGSPGLDVLKSTGEMIWLANDPDLPAGPPIGAIGAFNALMLRDNANTARVIFHSAEASLASPRFINGGMDIAVQLYPPYNPDQQTPVLPSWVKLSRDGSVSDLLTDVEFADVYDAPGGHVVFTGTFGTEQSAAQFTLEYVTPDGTASLWASDDPEPAWEVAWVSPAPPNLGMRAFPTVSP